MITKVSGYIPRFEDERGLFDIFMCCKCGYAVAKCIITRDWTVCLLCGNPLKARRVDYKSTSPKGG
jgi:hypothetical protein